MIRLRIRLRLRLRLRVGLSSLALLLAACTGDEPGSGAEQGTDTGDEPDGVTLSYDGNAALDLCTTAEGTVEFVTRRVDCWDPSLPCTVAQDPPWIVGTTRGCGELVAPEASRWEVTVTQTGRWETRLQLGDSTACFGLGHGGVARTNVSKDDLATGAEYMLTAAPTGECAEP